MIRVILVDDHEVVRAGTRSLLEAAGDIEVVAETGQGEETLVQVGRLRPDVILLDVRLRGLNGVEVARVLRRDYPDIKVVMLTAFPYEQYVRAAFAIGVHGYLIKTATSDELLVSTRAVYRGEAVLSKELVERFASGPRTTIAVSGTLNDREMEILRLISRGETNKQIAHVLGISEHTVETHVNHIMIKLNARSRVEAMTEAARRGVLVLEDDLAK